MTDCLADQPMHLHVSNIGHLLGHDSLRKSERPVEMHCVTTLAHSRYLAEMTKFGIKAFCSTFFVVSRLRASDDFDVGGCIGSEMSRAFKVCGG